MLVPGFQDAHVHPVGGGVDLLQCDLHDLHSRRGLPRCGSRRMRMSIRTRSGSSVAAGRWTCSRAACPTEGAPRCGRARPHRVPAEPRRPQHVGEQPGAGAGRGHDGDARSGRRPDRAGRGRRAAAARCTRAPRTSSAGWHPPPTAGRDLRGAARGPGVSAFAGDHRLAGRDRVQRLLDGQLRRVHPCRRQRRSHRPRRRGALVGPRPRRGADRRALELRERGRIGTVRAPRA